MPGSAYSLSSTARVSILRAFVLYPTQVETRAMLATGAAVESTM